MANAHKPVWRLASLSVTALAWSAAGLAPALAQESQGYYGPHMWGAWDGVWWMFLGPIWLILFLAVLIGVAVLIVRWISGAGSGGSGPSAGAGGPPAANKPLDILRERFARGEIDKEEFEERKRVLGG